MKRSAFILIIFLLLFNLTSFAKGTGVSGRGSGAHAAHAVHVSHSHSGIHGGGHVAHAYHGGIHNVVLVTAINNSDEADHFENLRTMIFNGYLVYGKDTLSGIMTCSDNIISLKMNPDDSTYMFSSADSNLKFASLYDNGETLQLQRLNDKRLYRIMHTGKLMIYDTYFSFDYLSKEFYTERSVVVFNGHTEKLNEALTLNVKKKLVAYINQVYNTNLRDEDIKRDALLKYVQHMN